MTMILPTLTPSNKYRNKPPKMINKGTKYIQSDTILVTFKTTILNKLMIRKFWKVGEEEGITWDVLFIKLGYRCMFVIFMYVHTEYIVLLMRKFHKNV